MEYVDSIRRDGELLLSSALGAGWDTKVPTCPQWTVRDLVRHQGEVHRWATAHVALALTTMSRENYATWPSTDTSLVDWFREGHASLVSTLESADPDLKCWTFLPNGPTGVGFWARRQAHETCMHRVDAQSVNGMITESSVEHAVDGIDEVLNGFFARRISGMVSETPYSFALDAGSHRWVVHVTPDGVRTTAEGPADATVQASAFDLYLLLWNRRSLEGLALTGDRAGLDHWRSHANVSWG